MRRFRLSLSGSGSNLNAKQPLTVSASDKLRNSPSEAQAALGLTDSDQRAPHFKILFKVEATREQGV
eukprot:1950549-Rhodomonas_salina.1